MTRYERVLDKALLLSIGNLEISCHDCFIKNYCVRAKQNNCQSIIRQYFISKAEKEIRQKGR